MIEFKNLTKSFGSKIVLKNFQIQIRHKEFVCIIGPSGTGKTTLFDLLIGREKPDSGDICIDGVSIASLSAHHLQFYRRRVGVIFQDFKLLPKQTVFENIAYILEVCGEPKNVIFRKVKKVLEIVGLEEKIGHFVHELSGGERQRIAIARSIVHNPKIILADEPTGNLDPENTTIVLNILKRINEKLGVTIVLATHDPHVLEFLNTRVVAIQNGQVVSDKVTSTYY